MSSRSFSLKRQNTLVDRSDADHFALHHIMQGDPQRAQQAQFQVAERVPSHARGSSLLASAGRSSMLLQKQASAAAAGLSPQVSFVSSSRGTPTAGAGSTTASVAWGGAIRGAAGAAGGGGAGSSSSFAGWRSRDASVATPYQRADDTLRQVKADMGLSRRDIIEMHRDATTFGEDAEHIPQIIHELRMEHRDGHSASRAALLQKSSADEPSLSRHRLHDPEIQQLTQILREAARVRTEAAYATQELASDFERDFKPANAHRHAASLLVLKSTEISARLQASGRSIEAAAAECLAASRQGAAEREATITLLQGEVGRLEDAVMLEKSTLRELVNRDRELSGRVASATTRILRSEIHEEERRAERRDEVIEGLQAQLDGLLSEAADKELKRSRMLELERSAGMAMRAREQSKESEEHALEMLAAEKDGRARDKAKAKEEMEEVEEERSKLARIVGELEYTSDDAKGRLKRAELDGKNLRTLCDSAVAKLSEMEESRGVTEKRLKSAEQLLKDHGIALEHEREERVKHLQNCAIARFLRLEVARGWTTWLDQYLELKHMRQMAVSRWNNRTLSKGWRKWVDVYPPKARLKRVMEPLEQRVAEAEAALGGVTSERDEALKRMVKAEAELKKIRGESDREREERVRQAAERGLKRLMQLDLARGFTGWSERYRERRALLNKAMARWTSKALWQGFGNWVAAHPPRDTQAAIRAEFEEAMTTLEEKLRREREAHAKTRYESTEQLTKESAMLRALVRELQNVLAEALKAPSWANCRQLLYHESCRYLPDAATHGKLLSANLRKVRSVGVGGMLTGRLTAGADIKQIVGPTTNRRAKADAEVLQREAVGLAERVRPTPAHGRMGYSPPKAERDSVPPQHRAPPQLAHRQGQAAVEVHVPGVNMSPPSARRPLPPPSQPSTASKHMGVGEMRALLNSSGGGAGGGGGGGGGGASRMGRSVSAAVLV